MWHLLADITSSVDVISSFPLGDVCTAQLFALSYFVAVRRPLKVEDLKGLAGVHHTCFPSTSHVKRYMVYMVSSIQAGRIGLVRHVKSFCDV